ncbi:MAG: UDP-N-acetylmuramoyl-tripeptide--D-alanyl-D-alanine ligase [Deltaproteobacteria bacterium]|nr:UDP-N-acetylmuramoyl-tripeptide--D-alanyl-D-alanine ligase [Deltaproteobacteria bacterium]
MPVKIALNELINVLAGDVVYCSSPEDICAEGITPDSREVKDGGIFLARRGETDDGHKYIVKALTAGASIIIAERAWLEANNTDEFKTLARQNGYAIVGVNDSTLALGDLARYWRNKLNPKTIAITGSVGKSTTKEILASLLEQLVGQGTANKKSYNNMVGLPMTVLEASVGDKWLLLEAGMNHAGELEYLTSIAQPDCATILNVEAVHLEFFRSLAAIADAKCELLRGLRANGQVILRQDNVELFAGVAREEARQGKEFKKVFFGLSEQAQYRVKSIESRGLDGERFSLSGLRDESYETSIPHLGLHNIVNACAAVATLQTAYPEIELGDIAQALPQSRKAGMRLEIKKLRDKQFIIDCYNANPLSMLSAFEIVKNIAQKQKFALILGDMRELGEASKEYHVELGKNAAAVDPDYIMVIGEQAEYVAAGACSMGYERITVAQSMAQIAEQVLASADVPLVLFKASRGIKLETAVKLIEEKLDAIPFSVPTS